jgi:hypothetical protein
MNIVSQPKQIKSVVEHKGVYLKLGLQAVIDLRAQSLTWDTLYSQVSRISLIAAFLQLIQQLPWDTLSHLQITDDIPGILNNFLVCPRDPMRLPDGLQGRGLEMSNGIGRRARGSGGHR